MSTIFPSNGLIKPAYLNLVKRHICFKKWAIPGLFFIIVTNIKFLQQINMKNVHPVYGAGIRTHDLCNISLLP